MSNLEDRVQVLDRFGTILSNDPGPLSPDLDLYVPNLHGIETDDVIETLARSIRRTQGSAMYYFSGQRGTGKSTELRRLQVMMNGEQGCRVYLFDVLSYIGESHPIQVIDLLLVCAIGFADALKNDAKIDFLKQDIATRFRNWLETEVEIKGFEAGGITAELKSQQQSVVERIRRWDLGRQERFVGECRKYIEGLAEFVRERMRVQKVVLIIDSLERLRSSGSSATEMFERVVEVFDGGSDWLRLPGTQVVYSVPPYLPYLTNVKQRVALHMLASVRVYEPPAKARRQPRVSGLDLMRRVVEKRFPDWTKVLSSQALDKLVLASGGDLRQLLRRFLLDAIDAAYYAKERLPLAASDKIIAQVIDKHRVEFEQMVVQEEYPLLARIASQNKVELPRRDDWVAAARFFDIRAVLNYRNGSDWVDLNPLLWPLIDAYRPADDTAAVQP
jgi:hypothetical protein